MWIARDRNGELYIYTDKPTKNDKYGYFYDEDDGNFDHIWDGFFPEVTWENSPKELVVKEE